ncbi:hypothetical protein BGX29_009834 [Mortierella sp. GBA35]|nr:hypothetical protein BGX23_009928 [Mortierella sp. AD031]KAF9093669.1 hypothetical protein BGX29_009834 [Mortierella sp. GBA35]KAG0210063.1 hypothetical protein BGX33_005154 [Mortierella sp. NVP41]
MDKALALPEILGSVGKYLGNRDIVSCMQVSKLWTTEFEPLLWRSFTVFQQLEGTHNKPLPPLILLRKNARHIRQLKIEHMDPALQDFFMRCKQLVEVKFDAQEIDDGDDMMQIWSRFSDMIKGHGRLRKVVIDAVPWSMTDEIVETFGECPNLIVLETKQTNLDVNRTRLFLRACSKNLRRLSTWCDDYENPKFPEDLVFQEMRYMDICHVTGMSLDTQLTWLSRCPNLISFRWESWTGKVSVEKLCSILSGVCTNLTALHLLVGLTDKEIVHILEAAPRIEKLSLPRTGFGPLSFIALRRHFPTLRDINLQFCADVTSPMVQEILHSCANLQSISAEVLDYKDVVRSPWACKGLQMFDIGLDVSDNDDASDENQRLSTHKEVYERLAQLTELNYLSISSETQMDSFKESIKVSLEAGLGALETLQKLTFFSCKALLDNTEPEVGFLAVQWMVEHWKRLETFEGTQVVSFMGVMDGDDVVEPYAMELLREKGIKFSEYILDPEIDDEDGDLFGGEGWTDQEYEDYEDFGDFEDYDDSDFEGFYEHFGPHYDDDDNLDIALMGLQGP